MTHTKPRAARAYLICNVFVLLLITVFFFNAVVVYSEGSKLTKGVNNADHSDVPVGTDVMITKGTTPRPTHI